MDLKRKKSRRGNGGHFTAEEMGVAEALLSLRQFGAAWFPVWGGKGRRSRIGANCTHKILHASKIGTTGSPISPLNLIGLSGSDAEEHCREADLCPTLPPLSSARRLCSAAQKLLTGRVVNPRGRAPKKKTLAELKEMVNALLVENGKLKKDKKQLLKTHQALGDWNKHLKSELGRRQGPSLASMQASLNDQDVGHKTEIATCFDEITKLDGHGFSKIISDALPSDLACKELCSNENSTCQHSPEFSCQSERDYSQPTKGVFPVDVEDLNVPGKAWSAPVRSGYSDYMLLSMEKAAFSDEARKQGIEHLKAKNCQAFKDRSRGH